jgi:hypothetical protein
VGSTFIPSRCAHIDTVGTNILIRGNMPLVGVDLHYAYEEIRAASGVADLDRMSFVEVPIIDNVGEREQFSPILRAFGVNPDTDFPTSFWPWWNQSGYDPNGFLGGTLTTEGVTREGTVVWRPFEGLPADTDPEVFLTSPGWDYAGFIDNLIDMMALLDNTAVYMHCQLGADRTGAAHIGYLMRGKGLNLADASAVANASTSAGPPNADYQRLVEAYSTFIVR